MYTLRLLIVLLLVPLAGAAYWVAHQSWTGPDGIKSAAAAGRARQAWQHRQMEEVIEAYTEAIAYCPEQAHQRASYFNQRGMAYLFKRQFDKAFDDFGLALQIDPKDASIYANRAQLRLQRKDWSLALDDLNRALELQSNHAEALEYRGFVWLKVQEYDKAIADLTRAIMLNPHKAEMYAHRAQALLQKGDYHSASLDCKSALRLNSQLAIGYYLQGLIKATRQEHADALNDLDKAIALEPEHTSSAVFYLKRAKIQKALGNKPEADQDQKKAKELNPNVENEKS